MIGLARQAFALLPERLKGVIDHYCRPQLASGFGPLNGQRRRQRMIEHLLEAMDVACIVETGTYRGTTTLFFSAFGLPVITVESNPRYYMHSRLRLRPIPEVTVVHQDSVAFLRDRLPRQRSADDLILFYLDAHWYTHLPTTAEIETIMKHFRNHIIVIDDFEVPGDSGYGFDDYGSGKRLSLEYLRTARNEDAMMVFFPAASSSEETGARRGSCVVTSNAEIAEQLRLVDDLRFFGALADPETTEPRAHAARRGDSTRSRTA